MYPPLFALKAVAADIWLADGPAISFYGVPFPTRMTIVRLKDGSVWLHSPVAFRPHLLAQIQQLGPVQHLVAPNWLHYVYLPEWQQACPKALVWLSPGVKERAESRQMTLHGDFELSFTTDSAAAERWPEDLLRLEVKGSSMHQEVVFFHSQSKTLILTDLIENFELDKCPLWTRPLFWLAGNYDPDGKAPVDMRWSFRHGKGPLRAALQQMLAWQPRRIILAHGRWYPDNAVAELTRAFRWV